MSTKSIALKSSLALVAAVLAGGLASSADAKTCWPYGTVTATAGIAIQQDTAKKYGRINWRVKVRAIATLGTDYDNWDLAEQRQYHCTHKLGTWRCNAEARPCRRTMPMAGWRAHGGRCMLNSCG